jgi:hypothetical protein
MLKALRLIRIEILMVQRIETHVNFFEVEVVFTNGTFGKT